MSDFIKKTKPIPSTLHSEGLPLKREEINKKIKNNFPYFRLFKLIIWIFIIFGSITYFSYISFKSEIITKDTKIIKIESGDNFKSLSNKYKALDTIWYKVYLQNNHPEYELKIGDYKVNKNLKIKDFLNSFKNPIIKEKNITILEGWNIFDIDDYLTNSGLIKKGDYIYYVENKEKIQKLTKFFPFLKGLDTLEGFLYPDTYKIDIINFHINTFVIKQLNNFEKRGQTSPLAPLLKGTPPPSGTKLAPATARVPLEKGRNNYNGKLYNLIILASIVEKEEKSNVNKPTVAGILKKRLDEGWMIGADITVCYPHKLTGNQCKMVVSKYIKEKNDYNTRTKAGLPKTPIGNPSISTIKATFNYKKTPYYFYLHDKKGGIHYATTNAGHEYNKSKYLY